MRSSISNTIRIAFLSCLLMAIAACGNDAKYQYVDFRAHVDSQRTSEPAPGKVPLKVAVAAMISPRETYDYYRALLDFLSEKLNHPIELVQRKTYGEVNLLFQKNQLDLAFLCSGPYATAKDVYGFEALATPQVRGKPTYQSYLIVKKDSAFQSLADLRGREFAFTDPESNTGSLVPRFWLAEMGESPTTFFKQTIYTYSHDNSIRAVAKGLVDAASVDGHKWEYYQSVNPGLTEATRVIQKSQPFGSPPLVAASRLPQELKIKIQAILTGMHHDDEGAAILEHLMIERFVVPEESWYDSVRNMQRYLKSGQRDTHAAQKS